MTLNEILVKLFRNINAMEEQALRNGEYTDISINDMHVIEAISADSSRNMTSVAKDLAVTTGTLTIAVNGLVKKGYVDRVRSEEDRRVVLISLTEKGRKAFGRHQQFHKEMVEAVVAQLTEQEKEILQHALTNLNDFFRSRQKK